MYEVIKYTQSEKTFYSCILPYRVVDKIAYPLTFSKENIWGYQRGANHDRAKRMKTSLLNGTLISPTSIILGCCSNDLDRILTNIDGHHFIKVDYLSEKPFRIVDGQHRLLALEYAAKENSEFFDYQLNIIIFVVDPSNRFPEVQMFCDINSLAVGVKIDLALLAKFNYDILEKRMDMDIAGHIAARAIFKLNESSDSVWRNGIKIDINNSKSLGTIGFKSFYESIIDICRFVVSKDEIERIENYANLSNKLQEIDYWANNLADRFLQPAWEYIHMRWPKCFPETVVTNRENEYETIFYLESCYLQKTIGTKAIHRVFLDQLKRFGVNRGLSYFSQIILNSSLSSEDWVRGGRFTGISSFSGANVISQTLISTSMRG